MRILNRLIDYIILYVIVAYPINYSYANQRMLPGSLGLVEIRMPNNVYSTCWIKKNPAMRFVNNAKRKKPDRLILNSFGYNCLKKQKRRKILPSNRIEK